MKTKIKASTTDKYQQLNEQLIKLLEQDLPPWKQDWRSQGFGNLFGNPYELLCRYQAEEAIALKPHCEQCKLCDGNMGKHHTDIVFNIHGARRKHFVAV